MIAGRHAQKNKKTRSEIMASIKSKNTVPELILRRALWATGLRYRIHRKDIFGTPDIVFNKSKVAIFVDSEFWHGKKYLNGEIPKSNTDFWIKKFERNIDRDAAVSEKLSKEGWTVVRFWESDVKKNTGDCVDIVLQSLTMDTRFGGRQKEKKQL